MSDNTTSNFWAFPPPSNITITSEVGTDEFNSSLRDHLETFSSAPPKDGFGSVELWQDDEIVLQSNQNNSARPDTDRWCLACILAVTKNAAEACDNYKDTNNTLLVRTPIKYSETYKQDVLEVPNHRYGGYFSDSATQRVQAAICVFSAATNPYNFTVPFVIVGDERPFPQSPKNFSIDAPEGRSLSTSTPSEPNNNDWESGNSFSGPPNNNHTGRIVGAVVGSIGALILFSVLLRYIGKRKRQRAAAKRRHPMKLGQSYAHFDEELSFSHARPPGVTERPVAMFAQTHASPNRYVRRFPGTSPAPFVQDRLSTAERGGLPHAGNAPPPAYEEIDKGRA